MGRKEVFRSNFEKNFASDLKRRKIGYAYEPEALEYVRNYIPDFRINTKSGKVIYIETKGRLRPEDRTKLLSVIRYNPDIDLRIVFQRSTEKLRKNSKTTYGEWATKHGIIWSEGTIPKAWLDE